MATVATKRAPDTLGGGLSFSIFLHVALAAVMVGSIVMDKRGDSWGGPGGAISVGVVGSVPAIPLPKPDVQTENRVVDETKGLYKAEPDAAAGGAAGCSADSEIRERQAAEVCDQTIEGL